MFNGQKWKMSLVQEQWGWWGPILPAFQGFYTTKHYYKNKIGLNPYQPVLSGSAPKSDPLNFLLIRIWIRVFSLDEQKIQQIMQIIYVI
jgi:hypothetical protein